MQLALLESYHFQMTSLKYVMFLSNTAFAYRGLILTPTFHKGTQFSDWFYIVQETVKLLTLDFPRRGFPTLQVSVTVPLSGSLLSHSIGWSTRTSVTLYWYGQVLRVEFASIERSLKDICRLRIYSLWTSARETRNRQCRIMCTRTSRRW